VPTLVIRNATIVTEAGELRLGQEIVVANGRISAVTATGESLGSSHSPDTDIYDAAGLFVMPGLIDAHSHLTLHREAPERHEYHPATPFLSARAAVEMLAGGVTTVRDLGGNSHVDIALRDAIARGDVPGPRILAAGQPIAATGGHIHYFCHEADGPDEVRKAVRTQVKAGADLIKIMLTGGSANVEEQPERLQLQPDEVTAAMTEAREAGRRVAVHAHTSRAVDLAARAGASSVEHGALLDDDGIQALIDTGCVLVPTHAVYQSLATAADRSPEQRDAVARLLEKKEIVLAKAIAAGVRIGVGTDSGRHFPQGRIADELRALAGLGLSLPGALRAATVGNAELLGIADDTGSITPGKRADLLVLRGNPATDLDALTQIERICVGGIFAEPPQLADMRRTSVAGSH
jgi:imidazolonepropionase-like amidohydrolase